MQQRTDPSVIKMLLAALALAGTGLVLFYAKGLYHLPWEYQAMAVGLSVAVSLLSCTLLLLPVLMAQEIYRWFRPLEEQTSFGGSLNLG